MFCYPIAVLRPSKKLFTLLGALCTAGFLFDLLIAPTSRGWVDRGGVAAWAVVVASCLATLRWSLRSLSHPSLRLSRLWLTFPILGLVWTGSVFVIIMICVALTLLVGALGAARFDPRGPMAAAFVLGTFELSQCVFIM
jgi:hypothetical protein